ncbi:MAG: ChaN family lipoprotein [Myxococcota bacterium]
MQARLGAIAAAGVLGCAALGPSWVSPVLRAHPLVGKIWDVGEARFVDSGQLDSRAAGARFVLLGEKHDNADHHLLQARLIRALARHGRRPAVVFEMIDVDRAPTLSAALAEHPRDADALGRALEWKTRGWPAWTLYRPIFEAALQSGLEPVAGNLSRERRRALRRGEEKVEVPTPVRRGLERSVRQGHCGLAPEAMIPMLISVQAARDRQLASALLSAASSDVGDGAVLIAGAGHVRRQVAVPRFLPAGSALVVAFLEVDAERLEPAAYADQSGFDLIFFTPRASAVDPCVRFREQLERGFGHPALERSLPRSR